MRVVMFVTKSKTFRWDWLEAAEQCAEVITLERRVDSHDWSPMETIPYLARDPENALRYRYSRPRKVSKKLFGSLADRADIGRTVSVLEYLQDMHGPIDVAHVHFYAAARFMPEVRRRTGIPYVITEHSTALTLESPDKAIDAAGLRLAQRAYSGAELVMPVSHSLRKAIADRGLTGNFRVVSNPVDVSMFRPAPTRPAGGPNLVSVARLARVKGFDVLLRAMSSVLESYPTAQLRIVGKGPVEEELVRLRDELRLGDAVSFEGHKSRSQIAEMLRGAHLFVLASRTENLPVAVIEAMASGLPVVATDVGGLSELLSRGGGHLVEVENPMALANGVVHALDALDDFDRASISEQAHARFSFEAAGRILSEVYEEAATS